MFTFGLLAQVLAMTLLGFMTPTLALHLNGYGIETFWIGLYFSLPCVSYILGSLLIPHLEHLINRKGVIFCACVFLIFSFFMIGTSPLLNFDDSPKTIFFGLCIFGVSTSAITIPVLPEMLD